MDKISHNELCEIVFYNPNTGEFIRRKKGRGIAQGTVCGFVERNGYVRIRVKGQRYQAHRLAWFMIHKRWPKDQIDHVNGDRSDNRIENLREASSLQNAMNKSIFSNNKSGLKCVFYDKSKGCWFYSVQSEGLRERKGNFKTKEEAYSAFLDIAKYIHGEYFYEGTPRQVKINSCREFER